MNAQLKRRLGLYAVFTVSIGAMIGSGIFVLPGLAFEVGGPSMILAYLVAGLIVFPAALAKSEIATAIPRAGGTYLYIDMAMGPAMGTIAGIGVWFSLVFKAAFALEGLGLYLGLFTEVSHMVLGLVIGTGLVLINLVGIKESGAIQAVAVSLVVGTLLIFVGGGATLVESSGYHPFFPFGVDGLFATAALVFVSYAGVTKVASLAEEIASPARTLPVAMISSLLIMMFLYPAVTYVMVGVTPPETLAGDLTPLATAGEQIFPSWFVTVVAIIGVIALASMASAGLLSSSRYPFAMARRKLLPSAFTGVGEKSGTPVLSILLTGGLLLGLVALVPVLELAKLASAFQLLMFALVNVAHIAFRSSKLWWYRPKFVAPGYPWVPLFGIITCLLLITQLGAEAIVGAVGIIVGGVVWYQFYGRSRANKESALRESVRQQGTARVLRLTERALADTDRHVVVVTKEGGRDAGVLDIARAMAGTVSDKMLIRSIPRNVDTIAKIDACAPDLLIGAAVPGKVDETDDLPRDRDVLVLSGEMPEAINRIAVLGSGGPQDVLKVTTAAKLAQAHEASLRLVHILDPSASRAQVRWLENSLNELGEVLGVSTEAWVDESEDLMPALTRAVDQADLVIIGAPRGRHFFTDLIERMIARLHAPVLLVRVAESDRYGPVRSFLDRLVSSRTSQSDATHRQP